MHLGEFATSVALGVGLPVLGLTIIALTALLRGWWLKSREIRLQEMRIHMEEKLRSEEINARIWKAEDTSLSGGQIAALAEEMRQLRQEVADIKNNLNSRVGGAI